MNIREIVSSAVSDSQAMHLPKFDKKAQLHRERSKTFVECLSKCLLETCSSPARVAALSKHHDDERSRFGMNELLFDIALVEYSTVDSGVSAKELSYVTKGIWIVESELARDKREALYDFNKLVLGDSQNKLFVGPRVSDEVDYLRVLGKAAQNCRGTVYVALIPHPDEWPVDTASSVSVWVWGSEKWCTVT